MAADSTKTISENPTNPVDSTKLHVYDVMNATLATVLTSASAIDPRWWVNSKGTLYRIINFKNKYNYLLKTPCYLKCEILMGCDNLGVSTVLRIRNRGKHVATSLPVLQMLPALVTISSQLAMHRGFEFTKRIFPQRLEVKFTEKRDILLHLEWFKR